MSPFVCSEEAPNSFTGGQCYDSKHFWVLALSVVSMIGIVRLTFVCENVYFSCNPFANFPTGEISARLRSLVVFGHHFPPIFMILDNDGSRRVFLVWLAVIFNLVFAIERIYNLPGYNQVYAKFLIGCCWLRLFTYLSSIIDHMTLQGNFSEMWLILVSTLIATYASSRYIDRQNLLAFGLQLKTIKRPN